MSINKAEFMKRVALEAGVSIKTAKEVTDAAFDVIRDTAKDDREDVAIQGFGTFKVGFRKERKGTNPQTGEALVIPGGHTIAFKPSKVLKNAVR